MTFEDLSTEEDFLTVITKSENIFNEFKHFAHEKQFPLDKPVAM